MVNPIELPSGKLLDLDRFIALVPNDTEKKGEYKLILEGYSEAIYLEQEDVLVCKEKLHYNLTENINCWNKEEQLEKNQPLISLMKKWLEQKSNIISTPEDEQEFKEVQKNLLKNRMR